MKNSIWIWIASLLFPAALPAQQVVAPSVAQVGSPRGENTGNYNYTDSFEAGYRWSLIGGDVGEYRSDVNFRNGVRLLSSSFSIDSKDGRGHYFDQIQLNTQGLGGDPYQSANLRVQKNRLYRYDMNWRLSDYFNPGLTVAGGLHQMDTARRVQDHEFTLFPQSAFRVRAGYTRNTQDGPALTTTQQMDANSAGLPIFEDLRRQWNEYRLGADAEFLGFKLTVQRRWDFYKEDTPYSTNGLVSAVGIGLANDLTVLQQYRKAAPVHGRNPGWMGNLLANHKLWAVNARINYSRGHNDFALNESAIGLNRFGSATSQQIVVAGNADRPMLAGNFNVSLFPTGNLTVVNSTSVSNLRINGPSTFTDIFNGVNGGDTIYFRYLGIRTVTNSSNANYRLRKWVAVYGGYQYTDRLVRTIEAFSLPAFANSASSATYETTNHLHSGTVGLRFKPVKGLTASMEAEIGRADNPLTPISDKDYHTLNGRIEYRTRRLQLSTSYKQFYNINALASYSVYGSHSRNYSANASYSLKDWFSLDANYIKLHQDTASGIEYFAGTGRTQLQTGSSVFLSNVHAANLGARFAFAKRADLYLGYTITSDTGDGRATAAGYPLGDLSTTAAASNAILAGVQTFPLTYQSPLGRLSIKLSPKLRWNAGYQFYNYHEQFGLLGAYQNFHAHTGYTSMTWAF